MKKWFKRLKRKWKKRKKTTYSKKMLTWVIVFSEIQIMLSYLLAFLGRENIAEALSVQVVITILGVVIPYFIKSTVENISKYTDAFGANVEVMNDELDF